ncbi:hypothetical protein V1511DRAFT_495453 [Dipodascopsis uninucleata]
MATPTDTHPLVDRPSPGMSEDNPLEVSPAPGSPIISSSYRETILDSPGEQTGTGSSRARRIIDPLEYDESGDEEDSLLNPQPQRFGGLEFFGNTTSAGSTLASSQPSGMQSYADSEAGDSDSATEADLLLPSPSSASSVKGTFGRRRWGNFVMRMLAYAAFGIFFILGWKLVFLPRTTLRRDLARLRHFKISTADVERMFIATPEPEQIREWSHYYTSGAHLAGQNRSQAEWTAQKFREYGFKTEIAEYHTYLNYPLEHRLALLGVDGSVEYEASLEEDVLPEDATTGATNRIPTFHGYSASGNVTAPFVYVNYGRPEDYDLLESRGVYVADKIVIARYGGLFRGLIVKGAQDRGAIGVLIYSDPGDDGDITKVNKYKTYPDGPARNPSSVQRGSVEFLSISPGDPTTPGYASTKNAERQSPYDRIPSIPSIPVSYRDMLPIFKHLNGMGFNPNDLGESWRGGIREFDYSVGPSTQNINLYNLQDYQITPIWNAMGRIDGVIRDEAIIVGNHRDAWVIGGAGDPNSGSAVMIELARSLGELKKKGWKPLRSIIFASWDGEEYGLLGSTEWGEEMKKYIDGNALAYLNVDVAVSGTDFEAAASPLLNRLLREVTRDINHPEGGSVYDRWAETDGARIGTLGSGSDYTVFQDHIGIPSIDMGFSGNSKSPVYHYHSNYDSFHWMDTYGDPTWQYHTTMVKLWGLMILRLSENEIVHFDVAEYVDELRGYLDVAKDRLVDLINEEQNRLGTSSEGRYECKGDGLIQYCDFIAYDDDLPDIQPGWWYVLPSLRNVVATSSEIANVSKAFAAKSTEIERGYLTDYAWFYGYKKMRLYFQIQTMNRQYKMFERKFLYEDGLDGRPWFKHIVYAPGLWTGYAGTRFPGLMEAIDDGDVKRARKWLDIINGKLSEASALVGMQ